MIQYSFYITYVFLITTGTITFIEAMRTNDIRIRNILNLETCISIVAAFFYSKFVTTLEATTEDKIDYKEINRTRYVDWSITTPMMLLVLVLSFIYNSKADTMSIYSYMKILALNYGMLGSGYLGEIGVLPFVPANLVGFAFFGTLFAYMYKTYLSGKNNKTNTMLFSAFLIIWSIYGVAYFMEDIPKNITYNILDLFAKCFVGIFFWAYFTKIFHL